MDTVWVVVYTASETGTGTRAVVFKDEVEANALYNHLVELIEKDGDGGYFQDVNIEEVPVYESYAKYYMDGGIA